MESKFSAIVTVSKFPRTEELHWVFFFFFRKKGQKKERLEMETLFLAAIT